MSEIKTERILVTGGSAGLGRAMVESFLARGADVTAVARDQAKLEPVARLGARVIAGNTCDAAFMDRVVKKVMPTSSSTGARLNMGTIDTLTFDEFYGRQRRILRHPGGAEGADAERFTGPAHVEWRG